MKHFFPIFLLLVRLLLSTAISQNNNDIDCKTVPQKLTCGDSSDNSQRRFFYHPAAGVCLVFEGCASTTANLFDSIELCILTCDPLGEGDRMSLNAPSGLDCVVPDKVLLPSSFRRSSREMAEAVGGDINRAVHQLTRRTSMVDWFADENGWTLLHHSADSGNLHAVGELVRSHKASLFAKTNSQETALHLAARKGHFKVIHRLLELARESSGGYSLLGKLLEVKDKCGNTALHVAASTGDTDVIRVLRDNGADFFTQSLTGKTALHVARSYEVIDFLLQDIRDTETRERVLNSPDVYGRTPIFYCKNLPAELKSFIIERSRSDMFGMSPLMFAVAKNDAPFVRFLVRGQNPSFLKNQLCCGSGRTVAHVAARFNSVDALKAVVNAAGVDVALVSLDWQGQDARCVAISNGNSNMSSYLESVVATKMDCFQSFLSTVSRASSNALHDAVSRLRTDLVRFLLAKGADASKLDSLGRSALHLATMSCSDKTEEIVSLLLDAYQSAKGDDIKRLVESEDASGKSPLELAVRRNCPGLVKLLLLAYRASCVKLNKQGQTPLHVAKQLGFDSLLSSMTGSGKCSIDQVDHCGIPVYQVNTGRVASCGKVPQIENGQISVDGRCISAKATISCNEGFELVGSSTATCDPSGHWQVGSFCRKLGQCLGIPNVPNALISHATETKWFTCLPGYVLQGSGVIRCNDKGEWIVEGTCLNAYNCGDMFDIVNGFVTEGTSLVGEKRQLKCNNGYTLVGSDVVLCSVSREWVVNGFCAAQTCGEPPGVENGRISSGSTSIGATRTVSCSAGYGLTGNRTIRCDISGHWSIPTSCSKVWLVTGIESAVVHGDSAKVEQFFNEGADVNAKYTEGATALILAAKYKHEDLIKLLIERGADINLQDQRGSSALHWATVRGLKQSVNLLLDEGVTLNVGDKDGWSELIWAARNKQPEILRLLVEKGGADVNVQNNFGDTALLWAAANGLNAEARLLIEKGAKVTVVNTRGQSPLAFAKDKNNRELEAILEAKGDLCGEVPAVVNGVVSNGFSEIGATRTLHCDDGYHVEGSSSVRCSENRRWLIDGYCSRGIRLDAKSLVQYKR